MTYWFTYKYDLPVPLICNKDTASTLASELTGYSVDVKENYSANIPVWTMINIDDLIYHNPGYPIFKSAVYHEVAHLLHNKPFPVDKKATLKYLVDAEFNAEFYSLKMAIDKKDFTVAKDIVNYSIVNNAMSFRFTRPEHHMARNMLLSNDEYINMCKEIVDLNYLFDCAADWVNVCQKS